VAALLLLLTAGFAYAQDGPIVMLETSLETPTVGSSWVLTLLTNHANPNQVSVMVPAFADGLVLEQVLQGSRTVNRTGATHAAAYERWTATEYRFVLNTHGIFAFDSFTVVTPRGQASTRPFTLVVQNPRVAPGARQYGTVWSGIPQSLDAGENVILTLTLDYRAPAVRPRAGLFMPDVPPGHILESLPVGAADAAMGTVLRLRLIPLEAGAFALDHRIFSYGNSVFEVPALRIPVNRSQAGLVIAAPDAETLVPVAPGLAMGGPAPAFPSYLGAMAAHPRLHQRYRADFEAAYFTALNLWDRGYRANALAVLRRNERDHAAGALFAEIRREAEAALGLAGTRDERRRRFRIPLPFAGERTRIAVLRETAVRRIPDPAGEEIARFGEGQPVTVSVQAGPETWVLVTADNGTSGWIPGENIILY